MCCFFFQAEDGIRDLVRSRGLGDVYKRQDRRRRLRREHVEAAGQVQGPQGHVGQRHRRPGLPLSLIHI